RKIRIDFGISIDFPDGIGISLEGVGKTNVHGAVGTIDYSVDGVTDKGTIIYIKSTLSGDEPRDVMDYASAHPDFPHETTTDQWFGESQFESYRTLGRHSVENLETVITKTFVAL